MTFEAVELTEYEAIPSPGLTEWLDDQDVALACTHTNKVLSVGRADDGRCDVRGEPFERVTALAAASDATVWLATAFQLWRLENAVPAGERGRTGDDRFYVPRFAHTVGNALPTDLGILADGTPIFGSITMSCLARPDPRLGLSPVWLPPFVTELAPDRRCYLSGLGMRDSEAAVVTCAAMTDAADGWIARRADGGIVVDVGTDEIIATGLCLPHSPRWIDDRWWLTQAGTGEVGFLDPDHGTFESVARLDAFVRGMCVVGDYLVVGGSGSRWDEIVEGLPVGERLAGARPEMGLFVIDRRNGEVAHSLGLDGTAREIDDVIALPGLRRVGFSRLTGEQTQDLVTFPTDVALG